VLRDPTWMHGRFLAGTTGRAKAQVRKPTLPARGIAVDLPDERADVASPYSQLLDSATFAGGAGDIDALGDGPVPTDETVETVLRLAYQLACNASWFCDDEDMSPGPEAKRARIAKVTGVDVPVGNGKLTMYHSDEYLSECANDVAVADPFCNEDDSDEGPVSDDEDSSALNGAPPLELFFPFSTSDPELSESEMSHLAHVADQHEIARLERMGVLKPLEGDTAHYSQLSTRFVRSFRPKPHPVTK
ncbi:unnamed protein product, partial [Symbiodinium necroappetens]